MWIKLEYNIKNEDSKILYLAINTETSKSFRIVRTETKSVLQLETPIDYDLIKGVIIYHYAHIAVRSKEREHNLVEIVDKIFESIDNNKKSMGLPISF